jgi:hypothetical protein
LLIERLCRSEGRVMPEDEDLVYRNGLSEEKIRELQKVAAAYRYRQNCITAAVAGAIMAALAALLLGVSLGISCLAAAGAGAAAGYGFYAWGKYLEEKHKDDSSCQVVPPSKIDEDESQTENQPLCPSCLEPVNPLNYYCPKCGEAGQLTPYIPFVNIRFNYSIFGRLWHKVWYEKTSLLMKIVSSAVIILFVPVMLIGVPFVIWDKLFKHKTRNISSSEQKEEIEEDKE